MAFRMPDGFVIALTYGPGTDWVRNVLATGGATIEYGGRDVVVDEPRLTDIAEASRWMPLPVRLALRLMRVDEFLAFHAGRGSTKRLPVPDR